MWAAWERQGELCNLCRRSIPFDLMHGDHIVPWSRGGPTTLDNLQALCGSCNLCKGSEPQQVLEAFFDVADLGPSREAIRRWQAEALQVAVEIDYLDVEQFIAAKLDSGLSAKKVRDAVSVLFMILNCAVRSNARKDTPAAGHHIDVPRRKLTSGEVLTMADVHRLVAAVQDPYKPAVWLMILTGIRPAELCGLRVGAVDFVRHVVHVHETLQPIHKFGDHPYALVAGPTKTEAGDRRIPIPQWLAEQLAEMLVERAGEAGGPADRADYVFVRPQGDPLQRDKFRQSVIRPALRAAGLPETLRTSDLRHSHASLLIDRGANVLAVAQHMGHSDLTVTLRVYGHLFGGVQDQLTAEVDQPRRDTETSLGDGAVVNLRPRRRASPPA